MQSKIKITKEEFDDIYEITEDTQAVAEEITAEKPIPKKEDTTPEFLTDEEIEYDNKLKEELNWNEEEDK